MRTRIFSVILLAAAFFFPSVLPAQPSGKTSVAITVTDVTGAPITNAKIRIVPDPDVAPTTEAAPKGRYTVELKPGGYALFVMSQGFSRFVGHIDVRESKEVQTIPVVMDVAHGGSVEVQAAISEPSLYFATYPYHAPMSLTASELKAMAHITVTFHNSHANADEAYSGVRLADILTKLGAPLGKNLHGEALANYIVATGSDGYAAVLAIAEVDPSFHPGEVLVADTMDGKPLDAHSGPFKLVVTEDKRPARSVRNLTTIELKSAE
jgi:hypothetical protein